jgi:hypothetical protein
MNTIIGSDCSAESTFGIIGGWNTQFNINGKPAGGYNSGLTNDPRLLWLLEAIGGAKGKRILELGPMEAAHTKMMLDQGASEIIAIEGLSDCYLKCLIVKEIFDLVKARFIFGDFCNYISDYSDKKFDLVTALGVLYHQTNPAQLIYNLAKITDTIIVWSQVASASQPSQEERLIKANDESYLGKRMYWGDLRLKSESYCASLSSEAIWMYPDEVKRCFVNAGFCNINEGPHEPTPNGDCLLFVASK